MLTNPLFPIWMSGGGFPFSGETADRAFDSLVPVQRAVVSTGRHKPQRMLDTPGRSRLSAFRTADSSRSSTRPLCKRCTVSSATDRPPCTQERQHPPDGTSFPPPFSRTTYRDTCMVVVNR